MGKPPRPPRLSDRWVADLPEVAQMYAGLWARGVTRQHERIVGNDSDGEGRVLDAILYIFCVRNLMRAAELVHDALSPDDFDHASTWLEQFELECPAIVDARDMLEHFDEYALGIGRFQKKRTQRTPLRLSVRRTDAGHVIRLTASGRVLKIDVERTTSAAIDLWLDLVQAQDIVEEFGGVLPDDDGVAVEE